MYSTSTLSLRILRQKFLNHPIPILKRSHDEFIRRGYFGGGTDVYMAYGENVHYYDVNSLYPFAMLNPMPHELINIIKDMSNIKLTDFFGYCLAEIYCPKHVKPMLPYKYEGKTIYPTGRWIGVYFSEELKAMVELGYNITPIRGLEFSKIDLFSDYINHFYDIKKNSFGAERFIAKMHLNQLYGYFGRKQELLRTVNVHVNDIENYITQNVVKTIIEINPQYYTLLLTENLASDIVRELTLRVEQDFKMFETQIKANVGIAAAVTSYARIHMIPFKNNPYCLYTDTDSTFTTKKLDEMFVGKEMGMMKDELGQMKDELNGLVIEEGLFLGIKQYGYWYYDSNNTRIEKSVFAGVKRDSLTFEEVTKIFNNETIIKFVPNRFTKSFKNLNIKIGTSKISIKLNHDKQLINNVYVPIHINEIKHRPSSVLLFKMLNKLKINITNLIRKLLK